MAYVRPSTRVAFARVPAPAQLPPEPEAHDNSLAGSQGRVLRQGSALVLRPAAGPVLTLRDTTDAAAFRRADLPRAFYYWGALPAAHCWVLDVRYHESSSTWLIDQRNGQRLEVEGPPLLSPDGRYLLSVSPGLGGGEQPNVIELYQLGAGAPRQLLRRELQHWAPDSARWAGPHTVRLQQRYPDDAGAAGDSAPVSYLEIELPAAH